MAKQILIVQESEERESTWYADVNRIIRKYEIEIDVNDSIKSAWKREVKQKINNKVEEEIKEKCSNMKKTRTIKTDKYEMKQYLRETSLKESADILKARLHMLKLPCNYGLLRDRCPLCGQHGSIETEHYFEQCQMTRRMADIWETKFEHLSEETYCMRNAKNHLKKVEVLMEQYMITPS